MAWHAGDGTQAFHDPIRVPNLPDEGGRTNPFFVQFYRTVAGDCRGFEAHEHTAQVSYEDRQQREQDFGCGKLPGPLLLTHHGAGRRYPPAQRRQHAKRAPDARELRSAERPGRAERAACSGADLLRRGELPRSVFLPASGVDGLGSRQPASS